MNSSNELPPNGGVADASATPPAGQIAFRDLSEGAREVLDDWRAKQGKRRPPKLTPALAKKLEEAVVDVGIDRLKDANTWAAERQVPEVIKAIRAAYTKRQREEQGGTDRERARGGAARNGRGAAADAAEPASPFAKYV